MWGTYRSLTRNAVTGVSIGHEKILELSGVGFRANIKGDTLNPGIYCLTKDVVSMNTGEAIAKKNSKIRVEEHTEPYSSFLGNNIYKVQHVLTKQELYISNEDIKR